MTREEELSVSITESPYYFIDGSGRERAPAQLKVGY